MNRREREEEAAATLCECRAALLARGRTVIDEATGTAELVDWQHYPAGEAYDPTSHAQYFFHRHPTPVRRGGAGSDEAGHFHLFLRGDGMPAGIAPLLLPEIAVANAPPQLRQSAPLKRGSRDEVCHLAAIAIDARGQPIRLFTTNRWVTGETWYGADDAIRMLDRFRLPGDQPSRLLNRWLEALVCLFQPDIAGLLRERDHAIIEWRWRRSGNPQEDVRLEIPSSRYIDLGDRLAACAAPRRPIPARLPRMAEGWGA